MNITYEICSNDTDMEDAWEVCIKSFEDIPYAFSVPKEYFIHCYKNSLVFIAKDDNVVIACLLTSIREDNILRVLIGAVLPKYRSLGITDELGALLRKELKRDNRGAKKIEMLILHFRKESADRFLVEKLGYKHMGIRKAQNTNTLVDIYYRNL